jgi:hypothetical protein
MDGRAAAFFAGARVYHRLMATKLLLAGALGLALLPSTCAPARRPDPHPEIAPAAAPPAIPMRSAPSPVDFHAQIRPILETRCQPCHFEGGTMYQQLPFDRPETIRHLGEKMFTRIKDAGEQEKLRAFLAGH